MADVHTSQQRRYNIQQIKSTNTKPEILVRKFLFACGYRYILHNKKLPGKPDIVLPKYKTLIFVHGCFWHGHEHCKYYRVPMTRTGWWQNKIGRNQFNDTQAVKALKKMGWQVLVIWECRLKPGKMKKTLQKLLEKIG